MDRRSSFGLVGLLVLLFGINAFFYWQHNQKMVEWRQKRNVWVINRVEELEGERQERTTKTDALPLLSLTASATDPEPVVQGVQDGAYAVIFPEKDPLPNTLFRQDKKYERIPLPDLPFALYRSDPNAKMPIVTLPPLGTFELQLVEFFPDPITPPRVFYATYSDGNLNILSQELNTLLEELPEEERTVSLARVPIVAIALLKTSEGYRPVGLYTNEWEAIEEWASWPAMNTLLERPKRDGVLPEGAVTEERFYVLQNPYIQLVFSNYGGALAEINLPFQSEENRKSVVKPIQYDRDILQDNPANAHFPLRPYYTPGTGGEAEYHEETQLGGFYPLLRRGLIGQKPRRSYQVGPEYYATNIVSEYPEVSRTLFAVKAFTKDTLIFEADLPYRRITKTYSLPPFDLDAPYCFDLTVEIEGNAKGLWISSGVPEAEIISNAPAPSLKYRITRQKKSEVKKIDIPKEAMTLSSIYPDWISNSNGFFGIITDPITKIDPGLRVTKVPGDVVPSRLIEIDDGNRYMPESLPGYITYLPLLDKGGAMSFRFFTGPYDSRILKRIDRTYTDPKTGENPDYIASQTFHGWFAFISQPFAKFLFFLLNMFHQWTGSWAFSIILLTVALRIMLYPLNAWSAKSMMKMQQVAPKIQVIEEKHKKDPKKVQLEKIALYREAGVNPISGCFPLLIQMPFLIGMFDLLKSSFALRGASFIPGWIDNLAAPDVLFRWNMWIPFFGTEFHLLPFVVGLTFFFQSKLTSTAPKDPSKMTDQQRQQQVMGTFTAVLFTFIFYNFPSGLNIYFISSTLLGMLQQWWTKKQLQHKMAQGIVKKGK